MNIDDRADSQINEIIMSDNETSKFAVTASNAMFCDVTLRHEMLPTFGEGTCLSERFRSKQCITITTYVYIF